jgi:hypothetical protein
VVCSCKTRFRLRRFRILYQLPDPRLHAASRESMILS